MHDYDKQLVLEDVTRKEVVATLDAKTNEQGQLLGMPVKTFFKQGGYALATDDQLKITATYNDLTGKVLHDRVMGVVGYFLPCDGPALAELRRDEPALPAKEPGKPQNQ